MAQIIITDGNKREVDKLTIVQMPYYDAKTKKYGQSDITFDDIQIALSHCCVCIDPDEYLEFAFEFDDFETSLNYLKQSDKFLALVRLSAKLNGFVYEEWLEETAIPALLKVHGMTKIDEE